MTILSACQDASIPLVGRKPATIFSSQDTFELELQYLATEGAKDIAKSHDWQALTRLHTITGDGTTTEFPFPSDYERMLIHAEIIDTNFSAWGYDRITDLNDWIFVTERGIQTLPGNWTMFGNLFRFVPAPASGAEATFPYITNRIVTPSTGTNETRFNSDEDQFKLSERLLTLWMIWRWREMKRLDYGADQANFEKAFNELAGRDKGSRIFRTGPAKFPGNVAIAYPFNLGS